MVEALEEQMNIYKCKAQVDKHNETRDCNRFLFKVINEKQMHIKCPSCGSYAIVRGELSGKLSITHIKEGEDAICKKAQQ